VGDIIKMYTLAANQGEPKAQSRLAKILLFGNRVGTQAGRIE
jgi:TPR repeat protein